MCDLILLKLHKTRLTLYSLFHKDSLLYTNKLLIPFFFVCFRCVIILIILCVIGAVGCKMWLVSFQGLNVPFLPFDINPSYEGLLTFWTYVIILQVMIPLSLYVTIELSKILQVFHIHNNIELFDHQTNKRTECRAMNITEELGQVSLINFFSIFPIY